MDDWELLNEYARRGSEEAFRALVDRYAGMVYHAALRQVREPHVAEEIAQAVFIALAHKGRRIPRQTLLYGWLFRATRFAALNFLRDDACRRRYEMEAMKMQSTTESTETDSIWERISPHLDGALEALSKADREVVMIRYFGNKSHREAAELLGVTEDTAKKRLSRALEKLRAIFVRRGVAVPALALAAALSAHAAQPAPGAVTESIAGAVLAKQAGAASAPALARGVMKLMAWAKLKTALLAGGGVLLAAAGTSTLLNQAASGSDDNVISRLEQHYGKSIAWDKRLLLPADMALKNKSFEQALDELAVQAGAYWTIDCAVYTSDRALRQLLESLHEGTTLESGGWTNLSSQPFEPLIGVSTYDPHGRARTAIRMKKDHPSDRVGMMVVLGPEATAKWKQARGEPGLQVFGGEAGPPPNEGPVQATIRQAMNDGQAEGVLAPERLLAEMDMISGMTLSMPMPATPEAAARLAKEAKAHWKAIYSLRCSPLEGAGIKLIHAGMEDMYALQPPPGSTPDIPAGMQPNQFILSPADRAAHQRAVEALKNQK